MKYKAIIFDMDGTIIDTEHIWRQARHDLIESRGIPLTESLIQELELLTHGVALHQSCKFIKDIARIEEDLEVLVQEKSKRACDLYAQHVRFINGFLSFHTQALTFNLKMGIATNADDQTVRVTDQKLKLNALFGEHIYNITHVNYLGKPNPAIYLHAARQLNVEPEKCIAIEDSPGGIKAAVGADMFCIGINTARKPALLKEAHMIIEGYEDIALQSLLGLN